MKTNTLTAQKRATTDKRRLTTIALSILASVLFSGNALAARSDIFADPWQVKRLFSPSNSDLQSENKGSIVIYSGLLDIDVDKAMDLYFDRIESMMFIQTIHTDKSGKPKLDKNTGEVVSDDDC